MIVLAIISVMIQMKIKADINADIFSQAEADVKRTLVSSSGAAKIVDPGYWAAM
jgi:hypothetical protein